jgi:hypothetical protein
MPGNGIDECLAGGKLGRTCQELFYHSGIELFEALGALIKGIESFEGEVRAMPP